MARYGTSEAERDRVRRDEAWGRGGRPSNEEINRQVARDREEARQRAQKRIDERKAISQARYRREDVAIRARRGLQTPEERAQEAAATIMEVEAAKAEDQNWVTEFTPQQEQEIAGYETAVQRVKSGVISGDIGLIDGGNMVQTLNQKIGSYQKIRRPRRKGEPWYPEGRKPNDIFTEGLTTYVVQPDGSPKLMVRPDQTPEYMERKTQLALEDKQQQAEEKRALEVEKYMRDLRTEQIEVTSGRPGEEKVEKRFRTPAEVYEATLRGYPELAPPMQAPPPVFGGEPEEVTQAKEALKTRGIGLKIRGEAKKMISAWEKAQKGNEKLTAMEIEKLPPDTTYIAPDGTHRRTRK